MDPITMIVTTLAAGALAGLKPTAEQAVKDAYASVKALIQRKYNQVDLTPLERKPESEAKRESVREDLADAGAGADRELLEQIKALIDAIEKHAPAAAAAVGVNLQEIKAASLKIRDVASEGTGVNVLKSEFTGDVEISGIKAGKGRDSENP